jgi:hypothetical protein
MNIKKDLIGIFIFLVFVVLYVVFRKEISGKYYFIIPAIVLCALSIRWDYRADKGVLKAYGIRTDNLKEATKLSALCFGPMAVIILAIFPFTHNPKPPIHFYFTIFLYPLWGLAQQFMFQSFFSFSTLKIRARTLEHCYLYAGFHIGSLEFRKTSHFYLHRRNLLFLFFLSMSKYPASGGCPWNSWRNGLLFNFGKGSAQTFFLMAKGQRPSQTSINYWDSLI